MQRTRRRRMGMARREAVEGYLFISPWIVGFILFTIGPMLASLYFSFTDYNIISAPRWAGLSNYAEILREDPLFWQSIKVTLYYAALSLPSGLVLGFCLAALLNQKIPGVNLWRTVYFLPSVISGVSVAILWMRIFNPRMGLLNAFLRSIGIKGPGWMSDPQWSIPALAIVSLWSVGGGMIIYLAGLQSVPPPLYDAAKVDGASAWQRLRHVTLPMMTPVIFYNLVTGLIATFQFFTVVFIMTEGMGNPARSTLFYNLYLYMNAFRFLEMGYASALAWLLFLFVLLLTAAVFRSSQYWVFYEGQLRGRT